MQSKTDLQHLHVGLRHLTAFPNPKRQRHVPSHVAGKIALAIGMHKQTGRESERPKSDWFTLGFGMDRQCWFVRSKREHG